MSIDYGLPAAVTVATTGAQGPRGNAILSGHGAPTSGTGIDGDYYLDTTNYPSSVVLYGPRASGTWPAGGVTLTGATGGALLAVNNLSDVANAATSRTNLGLGGAATAALPISIANGGSGQATQQAAINALTGTQSAGKYLRSDGTNASLAVIQAGDVPTLNQSTSGTSANVTGVVAIANGGSGQSTQQTALNALTGTQSAGKYLRSDGTNASLTAIQAADVPTLNQSTTGTAANVTGTVAVANGGTGATTQQAAINALAGAQSAGKYLRSDGTNTTLATIQAADVPTLNQSTTGTASNVTGVVALANGGTGATSAAGAITALGAVDVTSAQSIAGTKTFTGEVVVPTPVNPTDAVTKAYADAIAVGLSIKASVQEATAAALPANTYANGASGVGATLTATANGALTVDGVTVSASDRVLVQNEATASHNGLFTVTATGSGSAPYVLTRTADMNTASQVPGAFVFVESGTVNAGSGFVVAATGPFTIGTTAIVWTQFSGAGEITAGTGLSKSGNTISLSTPVSLANGGTGQASASAAYNALSPTTTLGDIAYASGAGTNARLAGNTSATKNFFTQTGTGSASAAPAWGTIASGDLPTATTGALGAVQLAGDLAGTGASPTVAKVNGSAVTGSASAGTALTGTAASAATWQGTQGPVYNVLTYGADATGATDSTTAIQNAINAAQSSAGIVYLPAGTFTVFGIPQITGSNIVIRGAGSATTIKLGSSAQNAAGTVIGLWVNGGSNIVIENLGFDGNFLNIAKDGGQVVASTLFGSSALGAAISTTPAAGTTETWTVNAAAATATSGYSVPLVFKVDSEQVLQTGGFGTTSWTVRRGFANSTVATHSNGAAIVNTEGTLFDAVITKYGTTSVKCYKSSQYAGGVDASTYLHQRMPIRITNASNVTVRGCLVQNSVSAGILADATSVNGCSDILITQNRIKLTWDNCVYFHQGVQYGTATGNELSDTMYNGVSMVYSDHVLAVGNNIRQCGPSFSDSGGVQINGSSNSSVTANTIDACQMYGVNALSTQETNITGGAGGNQVWASNAVISNNTITGCKAADYPTHTSSGVNVFGATGTSITGNTITSCDYGVSMGSKSTNTSVLSNRVTSCTSLGINIGNSADVVGTVVKGNHVSLNGSHGIYVNAPVRAEQNTVTGNTGHGINLSQPPTGVPNKVDWVIGNTITDNTDSGVYANVGAGNVAFVERNVFGNNQAVIFNDASITFNNTTVTSATAAFTSSDVGLPIVFMDQGSGGVTTATTVSSVTNSTTVVVASAPQATETGVSFWIGRGPATYTDGSTTNVANSVLTSATAGFANSDAGKFVVLLSQTLTPSILFVGTISSVTNSTTAVLSGAAGTIAACTIMINRSVGQQIRAINNASGTVVDRNNTIWGIPEILTGGNTYNVQASDRIAINDTSPTLDRTARYAAYTTLTAARTVTLPDATVCMGQTVVVADETGNAAASNLTVATQSAQTIDGASTASIRAAYGQLTFYSNGANWFVRAAAATPTNGLFPTAVKTGNYTAAAGDLVLVDISSGSLTVTLPTAPPDRTIVEVKTVAQSGFNTATIAAGGSDVLNKSGGATSMALGLAFSSVILQYAASPAIWYVLSDDQTRGYLAADQGLLAQTYDVALAGSSGATITSGTVYLARLRLGAPATITNLSCLVGTAGSGVTAAYMGLYNASGTLVAQTADRHADAIWTGGSGPEIAPLTATYAAAAGLYWVAILVTFTTTSPSIGRQSVINSTTCNIGLSSGAGNLRFATYSVTGQTTLPASITPTSQMNGDNHAFWVGAN